MRELSENRFWLESRLTNSAYAASQLNYLAEFEPNNIQARDYFQTQLGNHLRACAFLLGSIQAQETKGVSA